MKEIFRELNVEKARFHKLNVHKKKLTFSKKNFFYNFKIPNTLLFKYFPHLYSKLKILTILSKTKVTSQQFYKKFQFSENGIIVYFYDLIR